MCGQKSSHLGDAVYVEPCIDPCGTGKTNHFACVSGGLPGCADGNVTERSVNSINSCWEVRGHSQGRCNYLKFISLFKIRLFSDRNTRWKVSDSKMVTNKHTKMNVWCLCDLSLPVKGLLNNSTAHCKREMVVTTGRTQMHSAWLSLMSWETVAASPPPKMSLKHDWWCHNQVRPKVTSASPEVNLMSQSSLMSSSFCRLDSPHRLEDYRRNCRSVNFRWSCRYSTVGSAMMS